MSIERFKASLESCPISISLTYGRFHWPVFVLNTILAVSCVFRGSSFALEIRTCYLHWLYRYIFFGLIYSLLCWRTKLVCVSVTYCRGSPFLLQSSPKVHLQYIYLLFYIYLKLLYIYNVFLMWFYVIPDFTPLKSVYMSASLKPFYIYFN